MNESRSFRPRRRRKDARPSEIVEAARATFYANGFAGTRVEDIARAAGVSKGTVYLYFPHKEALFEAVARESVLSVIEGVRKAVLADTRTPAIEQLKLLARTMYREMVLSDKSRLMHLIIAEGPRFPWLTEFYHREILSQGQALIRALLRRGAERGELNPEGLDDFPEIVMAPTIVAGLYKLLFAQHAPVDVERYCEAHVRMVERALTAPR